MSRNPATYFTDSGQPAFSAETRVDRWTREFAFGELEPTAIVIRATYEQLENAYARPNQVTVVAQNMNGNIVYANYITNVNYFGSICYFCDDTDFKAEGANVQTWTREFASLPANFSEYETYAYAFPGFYPYGPNVNVRAPFTREVTSKLQHDFFLIGNTNLGANYTIAGAIPSTVAQNYAWGYIAPVGDALVTFFDGYLTNTNANATIFASTPNYGTYQNWMATDNANAQSYTIEATDSVLSYYRGPIWMRTRRFVKAR